MLFWSRSFFFKREMDENKEEIPLPLDNVQFCEQEIGAVKPC